jgi:hypothetical protein
MEIYKRFMGNAMDYATGTENLEGFVNKGANNK